MKPSWMHSSSPSTTWPFDFTKQKKVFFFEFSSFCKQWVLAWTTQTSNLGFFRHNLGFFVTIPWRYTKPCFYHCFEVVFTTLQIKACVRYIQAEFRCIVYLTQNKDVFCEKPSFLFSSFEADPICMLHCSSVFLFLPSQGDLLFRRVVPHQKHAALRYVFSNSAFLWGFFMSNNSWRIPSTFSSFSH